MKILFLPSWYPNPKSPYDGNFVENHAKAVALYHEVIVLFCTSIQNQEETYAVHVREDGNLKEVAVYFQYHRNKFIRFFRKMEAYRIGYRYIGAYDLIHTHVFFYAAFIGIFIAILAGKKIVHTEHSSKFRDLSFFKKLLFRLGHKKIDFWFPVSEYLKNELVLSGVDNFKISVIPNAIDVLQFQQKPRTPDQPFRFLHISTYRNPIKNIEGILRVFKRLSLAYPNTVLEIAGDDQREWLEECAQRFQIPTKNLMISGTFPASELIAKYQNSDVTVLFSHFETFGMVLAESLLCGRPVIATKVGGIVGFVYSGNGILVQPGNEEELYEAMERFVRREISFDPDALRQSVLSLVSFEAVGKRYSESYVKLMN